jgi:hypothetical protein
MTEERTRCENKKERKPRGKEKKGVNKDTRK